MNKGLQYLIMLVVLGFLAYALVPSFGKYSHRRSEFAYTSSQLRLAAIKVQEWTQSGGRVKMLRNLDDLPPEFIPYSYRRYYDADSGRGYDWLYYGDQVKGHSPYDRFILMASPKLFAHGAAIPSNSDGAVRVVAYLNCHTEAISEKDFRKLIEAQRLSLYEEVSDVE